MKVPSEARIKEALSKAMEDSREESRAGRKASSPQSNSLLTMLDGLIKDEEFCQDIGGSLRTVAKDPTKAGDVIRLFIKMLEQSERRDSNYSEDMIERIKKEEDRKRSLPNG